MGLFSLFKSGKKKEMMQEAIANGALIVDVREKGEFNQDHVKGSLNIPLGVIARVVDRLKKKGKPIVLCCLSGGRSGMANSILKNAGIESYNAGSYRSLK